MSRRRWKLDSRPRLASLVVASLVAVGAGVAAGSSGAGDGLEHDSLRVRFELRGDQRPDDVAVVAIDDVTFSELGRQWPFPRSLHARAVDRLHDAGAKEIVYDVQFTEPTAEREDLALFESIERAGGAILATGESDPDGRTNVLGGDENLASIGARAAASDLENDSGGVITRFRRSIGKLDTLAVATAERVKGGKLPFDGFDDGEAWIDYRGRPGTVPTISFSRLVEGRVDPRDVRGKIVIVGASSPTLQDVHATPASGAELMSGPEVQANAIWTAIHGAGLRSVAAWLAFGLIGLLGALAPLLRVRMPVLVSTAAAALVGAGYAVAAKLAFDGGIVLPVVAPLAALACGTVGMIAASHLAESRERRRVSRDNELLEQKVRERTNELRETQLEVVSRLAQAAESRDHDTGEHIERMSRLSYALAVAVGVSEADADNLLHASALHDIGKIGIPDSILLKPGKLTPEERAVMESHTTIGASILAGSRLPLLQMAEVIALTHHERWDGGGYPAGLAGDAIPLVGRICAICDVFDALVSKRPYKQPWTTAEALAEIGSQRDRQFEGRLVDAFLGLFEHGDPRDRQGSLDDWTVTAALVEGRQPA